MKYLIGFIAIVLLACSSTQYTVFKPTNETTGWKIECEQSMGHYTLRVDGMNVLSGEFDLFENNFESEKMHKGHKIQMLGHQRTVSTSETTTMTFVQIRVIIDDSEATKFDF